jgi:hypothetical protein
MRFARFATVAVLVLAVGAASADETVPNPEFANWSKFKKGTSVKLKTTSSAAGMTSETFSTSTLVEVGADKIVVEYETTTVFNGMEVKAPASRREIPKTITKAPPPKTDDTKQVVTEENGTETIKHLGREIKTKWTKNTVEANGIKTVSKLWMSDDVPGMMVKMETTLSGGFASTIRAEVIEIKTSK